MHLHIAFHDHRMHKHETQAIAACLGENPDVRFPRLSDAPIPAAANSGVRCQALALAGKPVRGDRLTMERVIAFVGCRTTRERNGKGTGLCVYEVCPSGAWRHLQTLAPLTNPSFLAVNRTQDRLYAVHGDQNEVSSYRIDPESGFLSPLNLQTGVGRNPVHLEFTRDGSTLVIAGYATGSLSCVPIAADGSLEAPSRLVMLEGRAGSHRIEQVSSHPHQVSRYVTRKVNSDWHIVPDKGLDTVFAVKWLADGTSLVHGTRTREGAGPRHAAFHPEWPFVYVVNELDSTLTTWSLDTATGRLEAVDTIPVIPRNYHGSTRAAGIEISADGSAVYITNRGHDTIARLVLDKCTCLPTDIQWASTLGKHPRFLCIGPDGKTLYVANEDSHSIVQFSLETDFGLPVPTGRRVETGSPVCIVFARIGQ